MSNRIFDALYREKIDIFKNSFSATSTEVFYDSERERLIHAGEYGMYRESVVRDFLKFIVPQRLDISTGFLMSGMDDVSTQCDIVVFDSKRTPLFQEGDKQRFFPIESVYCVGEVKSALSRNDFRDAINKLARTKAIAERIRNPSIDGDFTSVEFEPISNPNHIYSSILICKKLNFNLDNIESEINELYSSDVLYRHRHNMILSIDDGLLTYVVENGPKIPYPNMRMQEFKNCFLIPREDPYFHMKMFGTFMFMLNASKTPWYPEFSDYISPVVNGGIVKVQS